ncbi:hypothetical protein D0T49_07875 [Paludibacter sp. 221]|uniref:LiaF transmembrane domain-containing protein n=1 Tax=Paludibacter sp. 221 TaxID=2302939 RepID=UPI0013D77278|nr:hypothetical protein [Paludibacter sp. 221]NDV46963.1 hypothetical protein [Paludibacter sp. 221]
MKKDSRLAWGVTLLLFGILFLLKQLGIVPANVAGVLYDVRNYPIFIGVIFLICYRNKSVGWILLLVGVLLRISDIIKLTSQWSNFIWPVLLIVAGVILVFGVKKGKG